MADFVNHMDWSAADLVSAFKMFKQKCELYFSVRDIKAEKQVDYILLLAGEEGIQRFNAWNLSGDDAKNPAKVWKKFEEEIEPRENFRVARLFLQRMKQQNEEPVENFLSRCKLQAKKCEFAEPDSLNERLIEQLIAGIRHPEIQRELLSKDKTLKFDDAVKLARDYEASIIHMQQLKIAQSTEQPANADIHNISKERRRCRNCGKTHEFKPRTLCPAYGSTCYNCQKPHHWAKMCRSNQKEDDHDQKSAYADKKKSRSAQPSKQRRQPRKKPQHVHAVERHNNNYAEYTDNSSDDYEDQEPGTHDRYSSITFSSITIDGVSPDTDERDEVFANIAIKVPDKQTKAAELSIKVDTGAQGNLLPLRIFRRMCPKKCDVNGRPLPNALQPSSTLLTAYNETPIKQHGVLHLQCKYGPSQWHKAAFYVADAGGPAILGLPSIRKLRLVTLHCEIQASPALQITSVEDLVTKYPNQFDCIGHLPGTYHIVLDKNVHPVIHAPRKCPIQLRDNIRSELERMTKQGVIRKVQEPTDWVSSLAYIRKKNGELRICLDPKDLNRAIKRCHHRTPTLEELTHKFAGSKFFSKLDAKNGYWSVELDSESQLLTTFNSPFGRFCFNRMPFGLVMSQDVFQQRMDQILEQCPGTIGIADDVAVFGQTEADHDANLRNLMHVAAQNGLTFNSSKCSIKNKKIHFFGLVYDETGAHPDPKKVQDIKAIPAPTNVTQLQQFLGIVTYMSPFIPNVSQEASALRELLKKGAEFEWSASYQECFERLKSIICTETTLAYFDPHKPTTLQVDASSHGLGAALLQEGRPIAFASKSLTPAEQRYANIERELLAVVFGAKRFHTYVFGKPFMVESDHKPLEMISLKNLVAAPPRLQRMLLQLQEYDLTIKYKPGREMHLPDGLSRLPNSASRNPIPLDVHVDFVQFSEDKLTELKRETAKDRELVELISIITEGWPDRQNQAPPALRPYWSYRDELSVEDGLVLKGNRIIIPPNMQQYILKCLHEAHQGSEKCKLRAKECVFWSNINKDIDNITSSCTLCQQFQNSLGPETLLQHELPTRPWQILGTDLFHFDNGTYLIIADYYSKFQFVRKLSGPCTSLQVVQCTKQIFAEHGVPEKVVSDNGPHFDSETYKRFSKSWGFKHISSSPHYPRSNGFIERCIQTVKKTWKKAKAADRDLDMALLCLRTTPLDNQTPCPANLLYNRKIQGNLPTRLTNQRPDKDQIHDRLKKRQETQKQQHDKHARDQPRLHTSQPVYVQNPTTGRWSPGSVRAVCQEPRSYVVNTSNGGVVRRNRRHLRPAVGNPAPDQLNSEPTTTTHTTVSRRGIDDQPTSARPKRSRKRPDYLNDYVHNM